MIGGTLSGKKVSKRTKDEMTLLEYEITFLLDLNQKFNWIAERAARLNPLDLNIKET